MAILTRGVSQMKVGSTLFIHADNKKPLSSFDVSCSPCGKLLEHLCPSGTSRNHVIMLGV
jgi:hypothetical protein